MTRRRVLWGGLVLAACLLGTESLEARPGGGQSYSRGSSDSRSGGSSSSGSSSSSSSGGESGSDGGGSSSSHTGSSGDFSGRGLFWGIVLLGVVYGFGTLLGVGTVNRVDTALAQREGYSNDWDSNAPSLELADLRKVDPDFSVVLFEDFAYALYAQAHRARHDPAALARLAPYLSQKAQKELAGRQPLGAPVQAVLVGSMRPIQVRQGVDGQLIVLSYESNITVETGDGPRTEYVEERWRLARSDKARTRPWTGARTLGCPSCGAPFESTADSRCVSCGQVAQNGRFDWYVTSTELSGTRTTPPALTGTVEEQGTDAFTVFQPLVRRALTELFREDPTQTEEGLRARLRLIFGELQRAWAAQDLRPVRPFVTDALFHYLQYWVDAYRAQGLRNVVDGARVLRCRVAKLTRDAHYDAVTIRMWATGCDYTTDASGQVVGGSREKERTYSEYWTLARGVAARGKAARSDKTCPACAAPLDINMAGNCEHCGAHVTAGEFDWVLSKIEQDDSYSG